MVLAEPGRGKGLGGRAAEDQPGRQGRLARLDGGAASAERDARQQADAQLQQERAALAEARATLECKRLAREEAQGRLQQERVALEGAQATLKQRDEEVSRLDGELNQLSVSHEDLGQSLKEQEATILSLRQAVEDARKALYSEKK
jgi:chromosome segregation ATPase